MSRESIKRWHTTLDAVFAPLERFLDKRRRKKSFEGYVVCGHGRDALRYYENGHYVVIEAELMCGELDRRIWRPSVLKWDDKGERLSDEDVVRVIQNVCDYFDRRNVRWIIGDGN